MKLELNWAFLGAAPLAVVGLIEWLKSLPIAETVQLKDKVPSWIWWALMPIVCAGITIVAGGEPAGIAIHAAVLAGICEIGYAAVVKRAAAVATAGKP